MALYLSNPAGDWGRRGSALDAVRHVFFLSLFLHVPGMSFIGQMEIIVHDSRCLPLCGAVPDVSPSLTFQ